MAKDLNQVLQDIGIGSYHWVQLLLVGGVMISDGAEILVSSSLLSALKGLWHLTPLIRGLMMSTIFVGVFIGGLVGGYIGDAYGRRRGVLVSYVGLIIFGTATAAAQGPISMLILRFFFGASFGCGMGPGMAMQVETSPANWRAHIINLGGVWFSVGEIYTSVLLIIFMPDLTDPDGSRWRWVTLLSMVPGFLLFPFTYFLLQETPYYLLANGRKNEAVRSLQYIATMNGQSDKVEGLDGSDPEKRLASITEAAAQSSSEDEQVASSLLESTGSDEGRGSASSSGLRSRASGRETGAIEVQDTSEEQRANKVNIRESLALLFSAEYFSIVLGGAYVCFLSNFLFYGLTYALPQIFKSLGHDLAPAVQVLIISVCDLPGVLLAFFLIYSKRIGHRDGLVILSTCAAVFSLTLISIDHGDGGLYIGLPSAYLVKYVSSAFFTLAYVYLSEIFPSKVRASGLSLCIASGRLGSITSPLIVESLHTKGFILGEHAPFMLATSFLCVIGIAVIKLTLHFELKNAPLQESMPKRRESRSASKESSKRPSRCLDPEMPAPAG